MKQIPFSLLPTPVLINFSRKFVNAGVFVSTLFPFLRDSLAQAESEFNSRQYGAIAFTAALTNAVVLGALAVFVAIVSRNPTLVVPALMLATVVAFASFVTIIYFPQVIAKRRMRALETQLIPALRQMLIEIKSGVPLFNAMASISMDYGEVSKEFKKMVQRINSGTPELDAIADATTENPSHQFRRVLWQLSNALKVGSDVSKVMELQIEELTKERIDQIRKYGQELSPWTMIYMMTAVILPSLGVTMLIVVVAFVDVTIPKLLLPAIAGGLMLFQLFFMNFVSSRRPAV